MIGPSVLYVWCLCCTPMKVLFQLGNLQRNATVVLAAGANAVSISEDLLRLAIDGGAIYNDWQLVMTELFLAKHLLYLANWGLVEFI